MIVLYLSAVVIANLTIARFGPIAAIPVAFLAIGLDLTSRDRLHDRWHGRWLWPKMLALILTGSLLSWLLNVNAGKIALASAAAFVSAGICDALTYTALGKRSKMVMVNGSNVVSALVDSLVFPTLAFGMLLPLVILGQYAAKVAGGFLWALILYRWRKPTNVIAETPQAARLREARGTGGVREA